MAAIFEEFANGDAFNASDFNTYSMRQAIICCDNQTDRDSIATPQEGLTVYRKDIDQLQVYTGSRWKWVNPAHRLGSNIGANTASGGVTNAYATYATVASVTTLGGTVQCEASGILTNASSGADRTCNLKVQADGVDIGTPYTGFVVPLASTPHMFWRALFEHTPSAGSYTYTFQVLASNNTSVTLLRPTLVVNEIT